ncbi:MAG TPA: hypothetical protein VFC63_22620 [Blastocatellia bacterium]|nr:hypothetical protein [Blastocatellia bacterium]
MKGNRLVRHLIMVAIAITAFAISGSAAQKNRGDRGLTCNDDSNWNDRLVSHCEIREETISGAGSISVDGRQNGGVTVRGWDQNNILVRSRVQAAASTEQEARDLAGEISIRTSGGRIYPEGPSTGRYKQWSVNFEVFVPRHTDLSLRAHNGGISISEVNGRIEFETMNGGVTLNRLAGNVRGNTTNGGLNIILDGDHWDGEGMDVWTTNGGVTIGVPENYSAHLETSTVNGGLNFGFPITLQGRLNRDISIDLGSGGATLKAVTTNGGVDIRRR